MAQRITIESISNVRLLPLQPRDDYLNIINSSDISLVSLDERMKAPCIPGKLVNLMAMKQPIIAIVPVDSETAKVICESRSGIIVEPGNSKKLIETILYLINNKTILENYMTNGFKYSEMNMNLDRIVFIYENIFLEILDKNSKVAA